MKIYISGKITGDRRYKAKFREVEKKLAAAGHIVLNPATAPEGLPEWVILGAETGNRQDKVTPARKWVDDIVAFCEENEIPVFFKNNLREHFPDLPASAFPWEV